MSSPKDRLSREIYRQARRSSSPDSLYAPMIYRRILRSHQHASLPAAPPALYRADPYSFILT
ncbi:MAG: hypothetical protein P1U50_11130 [Parvibaculaceae bacterium]|nr:hypothetical protein [Parvibaculaceae bacterium]